MKTVLKDIARLLVLLVMIIASAGALNHGVANTEHFYTVCGALNLVLAIYIGVKRAKELISK